MLLKYISKLGKIFNSSIADDFEESFQNWHLKMIFENMHPSHYSFQHLIFLPLSNLVCQLVFIANSTEHRDTGEEGISNEEFSYSVCSVSMCVCVGGGHCLVAI